MRTSVLNRRAYSYVSADNSAPSCENTRVFCAENNSFADADMVSAFVFSALRLTILARIIMIIRIIKCKSEYALGKGKTVRTA